MKRTPHSGPIGVKPLDNIFDQAFDDPAPRDRGDVAARGYTTEDEHVQDPRAQRSRARQTFFNNDRNDGENI